MTVMVPPIDDGRRQPDYNSVPPLAQSPRRRILIVEDDATTRQVLFLALTLDGYDVDQAKSGNDCRTYLQPWVFATGVDRPPDLVISDIRMPGLDGLAVLRLVRTASPSTPVVLITAFGSQQTHAEAARLGAAAVIDKPFDLEDLRRTVRELLRTSS